MECLTAQVASHFPCIAFLAYRNFTLKSPPINGSRGSWFSKISNSCLFSYMYVSDMTFYKITLITFLLTPLPCAYYILTRSSVIYIAFIWLTYFVWHNFLSRLSSLDYISPDTNILMNLHSPPVISLFRFQLCKLHFYF